VHLTTDSAWRVVVQALREEIAKLYDTVTADQVVVCVPEEGMCKPHTV